MVFRTIGIYVITSMFFYVFFKIQKVVTFYVFCRVSYVFSNYGSDHEYTLSEPTAVANGADWLHLRPVHPRKTLYKVPQGFSLPGKQFLTNSSQHFGDLYWIKP